MRSDGSKILNPGDFRHRITWQEKTVTGQDSLGQDVFTWTDVITTPCQVLSRMGSEKEFAQQRWAEAQFVINMHYISSIKREMRGVWGDRILDVIDAEDPWGKGAPLRVYAKEWVE